LQKRSPEDALEKVKRDSGQPVVLRSEKVKNDVDEPVWNWLKEHLAWSVEQTGRVWQNESELKLMLSDSG